MKEAEVAEPALTGLVEVRTAVPPQVGSLGAYNRNVTVPVGLVPFAIVAVSESGADLRCLNAGLSRTGVEVRHFQNAKGKIDDREWGNF